MFSSNKFIPVYLRHHICQKKMYVLKKLDLKAIIKMISDYMINI